MNTAAAATPHYLATGAAIDVLALGGTAVDAAIAANAVLGVVAPETCGLGGDLFALLHRPGWERPHALNASGRAGSGVNSEALRRQGHLHMPQMGTVTVTVPGCVDGWHALAEKAGRLGWKERLAPAIRYAEQGFPVSSELARSLAARHEQLKTQPIARHLFPAGRPPRVGHHIFRPDLAATLALIQSGDRDDFYLGPPGSAISEAVGGLISEADLGEKQAEWAEPLGRSVFGIEGWTVPPNSQGYLTLAAAAVYERWQDRIASDTDRWHLTIEAYRSQVADRHLVLADPDHSPIPARDLLSEQRLSTPIEFDHRSEFGPTQNSLAGTAYLCVLDAEGLGVSLIQSNFMGLGNALGAGQAGFLLQNRGAGFNLVAGHPNELVPGKRPLHTLSPTLWTSNGRLHMLLGTRGGDYQPQLLLQMVVRLFGLQESLAAAQAAPRWVIDDLADPSATVRVESPADEEVIRGLRARGHKVDVVAGLQGGWGPVSVIRSAPAVEAAADPRAGTASAETL